MKLFNKISAFAVLAVMALGCSGTVDEAALPILAVSDSEIDLASESEAVFTVKFGGVDVTGKSVITDAEGNALRSNVFIPESVGIYTFTASYDGRSSNAVTVNVINSAVVVKSQFDRHVCLIEFTGAWCINCPEGYDNMYKLLYMGLDPSISKYRNNVHIAAFHSEKDELAIEATEHVFALFPGLLYPSFALDLRDCGALKGDGWRTQFKSAIKNSFENDPTHCGVAVSSNLSTDGKTASVTVKVTSELTAKYKVILLVVEDNIYSYQLQNTVPKENPNYRHRHVVRKVATAYTGRFTGESVTEDGVIAEGEEVSKTWTLGVDEEWNLANTEIYALVLNAARNNVNNMNVCAIDGGSADYDREFIQK